MPHDSPHLETYVYAADVVGWRLGEALAERALASVRVRMLVDAAGSLFSLSRDLEGYLGRQALRFVGFTAGAGGSRSASTGGTIASCW